MSCVLKYRAARACCDSPREEETLAASSAPRLCRVARWSSNLACSASAAPRSNSASRSLAPAWYSLEAMRSARLGVAAAAVTTKASRRGTSCVAWTFARTDEPGDATTAPRQATAAAAARKAIPAELQ
eukprot:CAMPEP_0176105374 /NCGR_PEP_ID=MMETSP0120_2-20121206/52878_1 /TAXON_ID=160619 /ORGANISM="Kryptoperidinium foliaceum, Strain CCMP 1326" /LENGTH=127 /DNA_ID=CAMNT_0017439489 /DNA_START=56 /DNA_END=439 /DNA_ORIENTATION=+